ncbi:alpha/beta fold hydrolase [Pseudonocardia kujensis]|uniref:esterase/lipase family protein n=1 Tax=Pseudonocardia kujensis TaxID=1128675 RepID=UPI001E4E5843|nr:alpha/beta fold hydrolase [Pseudonocardia kujensis]MCE0766208.1 alpha/beta fold hydrolase [Pseudonocardia kujensis]
MRNVARTAGFRVAAVLAAVTVGLGASVATAAADEDGPALQVPEQALARSLSCTGDLDEPEHRPVLLIPGTTLTPAEFSWNYARAFAAEGRPFCTVELPDRAMGDIQVAAEYVVAAVRTMSERAGGPVDVVGHSQGGMITRWALKFWPDTRHDVDDLVGLAPSNHGTVVANGICLAPGGCAAAIQQQRADARFLAVLNAGRETYDEVDYTVAFTDLDEVVVPNVETPPLLPDAAPPASSALRDGGANVRNVSLQSICPAHPADHLTIGTSDAVAYALVVDALDHDGPADPDRIDRAVCLQPFQPGVDPATFPTDFAQVLTSVADALATTPRVAAEPPLQPYAETA